MGLPALIFILPFAVLPRNHGGREIGRVTAKQGRQHFLEVARRNPVPVKRRQKHVKAFSADAQGNRI